eukprot:jgi/Psemu1/8148/gm1.8148_g
MTISNHSSDITMIGDTLCHNDNDMRSSKRRRLQDEGRDRGVPTMRVDSIESVPDSERHMNHFVTNPATGFPNRSFRMEYVGAANSSDNTKKTTPAPNRHSKFYCYCCSSYDCHCQAVAIGHNRVFTIA